MYCRGTAGVIVQKKLDSPMTIRLCSGRDLNLTEATSFIDKIKSSLLQNYARSRNFVVMKCHEQSERRKPVIVKVGNAAVKIYQGKSRGYDLFTLVHYAGGQRKRETFAKLTDAKRRAGEVARAMLNGRLAVLELTSADREGYVSALQLLEPFGIPLHSAVEEYVAARAHLRDGESLLSAVKEHAARRRHVINKSVEKTVEEFLLTKKRDGVSHRYLKSLRSDLRRLGEAFRVNISSVTSGMLVEWLKSLSVGARARNNIRASVVTLFRFAQALGYLPR